MKTNKNNVKTFLEFVSINHKRLIDFFYICRTRVLKVFKLLQSKLTKFIYKKESYTKYTLSQLLHKKSYIN